MTTHNLNVETHTRSSSSITTKTHQLLTPQSAEELKLSADNLLNPKWKCCPNEAKEQKDAMEKYMLAAEKFHDERAYEKAVECYNKAVPLARKLKKYNEEAISLSEIALMFITEINQYEDAFKYVQNSRLAFKSSKSYQEYLSKFLIISEKYFSINDPHLYGESTLNMTFDDILDSFNGIIQKENDKDIVMRIVNKIEKNMVTNEKYAELIKKTDLISKKFLNNQMTKNEAINSQGLIILLSFYIEETSQKNGSISNISTNEKIDKKTKEFLEQKIKYGREFIQGLKCSNDNIIEIIVILIDSYYALKKKKFSNTLNSLSHEYINGILERINFLFREKCEKLKDKNLNISIPESNSSTLEIFGNNPVYSTKNSIKPIDQGMNVNTYAETNDNLLTSGNLLPNELNRKTNREMSGKGQIIEAEGGLENNEEDMLEDDQLEIKEEVSNYEEPLPNEDFNNFYIQNNDRNAMSSIDNNNNTNIPSLKISRPDLLNPNAELECYKGIELHEEQKSTNNLALPDSADSRIPVDEVVKKTIGSKFDSNKKNEIDRQLDFSKEQIIDHKTLDDLNEYINSKKPTRASKSSRSQDFNSKHITYEILGLINEDERKKTEKLDPKKIHHVTKGSLDLFSRISTNTNSSPNTTKKIFGGSRVMRNDSPKPSSKVKPDNQRNTVNAAIMNQKPVINLRVNDSSRVEVENKVKVLMSKAVGMKNRIAKLTALGDKEVAKPVDESEKVETVVALDKVKTSEAVDFISNRNEYAKTPSSNLMSEVEVGFEGNFQHLNTNKSLKSIEHEFTGNFNNKKYIPDKVLKNYSESRKSLNTMDGQDIPEEFENEKYVYQPKVSNLRLSPQKKISEEDQIYNIPVAKSRPNLNMPSTNEEVIASNPEGGMSNRDNKDNSKLNETGNTVFYSIDEIVLEKPEITPGNSNENLLQNAHIDFESTKTGYVVKKGKLFEDDINFYSIFDPNENNLASKNTKVNNNEANILPPDNDNNVNFNNDDNNNVNINNQENDPKVFNFSNNNSVHNQDIGKSDIEVLAKNDVDNNLKVIDETIDVSKNKNQEEVTLKENIQEPSNIDADKLNIQDQIIVQEQIVESQISNSNKNIKGVDDEDKTEANLPKEQSVKDESFNQNNSFADKLGDFFN